MNSIKINTGKVKLLINDGPECLEFNPDDLGLAERFYRLMNNLQAKQEEYRQKAEQLDQAGLDERGLPVNLADGLVFLREVCEYLRGEVDQLFGAGTSQRVFGDVNSLDMFEQLFDGIAPYMQSARSKKISRYLPPTQPAAKGKRRKSA